MSLVTPFKNDIFSIKKFKFKEIQNINKRYLVSILSKMQSTFTQQYNQLGIGDWTYIKRWQIRRLQKEHWNFVLTPNGWPFNQGHQIKLTHLLSKWGDSFRVTNSITYICQCPWSCYPNLLYGKQWITN